MQETAQQYISRIQSYLGKNDPLSVLASTPNALRAKLHSISDTDLRTRPTPTRWSILEQVVHLSDVEIVVGYRVRAILGAEDGVPIQGFDQDKWQTGLNYNGQSRSLHAALDAFEAARKNNIALYRSLSESQWNRYGMHSERGKESVRDMVVLNAGHDINHVQQIDQILSQQASAAAR
jgi:hypothetical protein